MRYRVSQSFEKTFVQSGQRTTLVDAESYEEAERKLDEDLDGSADLEWDYETYDEYELDEDHDDPQFEIKVDGKWVVAQK
jgi:hypothetical protein